MAVAAKAKRGAGRVQPVEVAAKAAAPAPGPAVAIVPPDPQVAAGGQDIRDPLATRIGTRIDPASMIFDGDWYVQNYPDVAAAKLDPVRHFFDDGSREGRNPNRYFDTVWYASTNPDVAAARLNPFLHYLLYGAVEGRKPAP